MCKSRRNYHAAAALAQQPAMAQHPQPYNPLAMPTPTACGCHYTRKGRFKTCCGHRHGRLPPLVASLPAAHAQEIMRAHDQTIMQVHDIAHAHGQAITHAARQTYGPIGLLIHGVTEGVKCTNRKVQEHKAERGNAAPTGEVVRMPASAKGEKNGLGELGRRSASSDDDRSFHSMDEVERREWEEHWASQRGEQPPSYERATGRM